MPTWEELSYRVAQASCMVSVQARCTVDEAIVSMQERAEISHQSLTEIAEGGLERRIRFS